MNSNRKRRLKIYVEAERGGTLVPIDVRLLRQRLILEITEDSRGQGEMAALHIMKMLTEMFKSAGVVHETDMPSYHKKSPHRLVILLPTVT